MVGSFRNVPTSEWTSGWGPVPGRPRKPEPHMLAWPMLGRKLFDGPMHTETPTYAFIYIDYISSSPRRSSFPPPEKAKREQRALAERMVETRRSSALGAGNWP